MDRSAHTCVSMLNEMISELERRGAPEPGVATSRFAADQQAAAGAVQQVEAFIAELERKVGHVPRGSVQSGDRSSAPSDVKEKGKKKAAPATKPAPATEVAPDADPSKLDIRVGVVTKCWEHPDSEKLYCEEIDVGEETVRSIASGLRAFYASASDIQNRKVLVLVNLKERPLAGFKSQGMVLCATNDDHSVVQLVEPPACANPGDRVTFAGFLSEPATIAQMAKKKIFEKLAPKLKTDENGIACFDTVPFEVGGQHCVSSVKNAHVS